MKDKAEIIRLKTDLEEWADRAEKAESELAELREAVARCFDCEDFQGGRAAWEQLREMIGEFPK